MAQNIQTLPGTKPKFSEFLKGVNVRNLINNTLSDPQRAARFVASISAAVASSPTDQGRYSLRDCDPNTILTAALVGESLNLSPSPQIGHYYLVPFKQNAKYDRQGDLVRAESVNAVFVLGYKGYLQLAMRSGVYRHINVLPLKAGELKKWNPLTEEVEVQLVQDEALRETLETTHYFAGFEYLNGFRKAICWTRDKMEAHALRYSAGYSAKKGYTFWEKDFDGMAQKTMLRQLIGKWGLMSTEMQTAFERDDTYQPTPTALPAPVVNDDAPLPAPAEAPKELPAPQERPTVEIGAAESAKAPAPAASAEHGGGNPPPRPAAPVRNGNLF